MLFKILLLRQVRRWQGYFFAGFFLEVFFNDVAWLPPVASIWASSKLIIRLFKSTVILDSYDFRFWRSVPGFLAESEDELELDIGR